MRETVIKSEGLCRDVVQGKRGCRRILSDVSFEIKRGEMTAIIGSSGAGKSTLMGCLCGAVAPTSGKVYIEGDDMSEEGEEIKAKIGFVPQADTIHGALSVRSMLRYAARLRLPDARKEEIRRRVEATLTAIGLEESGETMIKKLSGGERKRAGIAVELVGDAQILFLDEPTSGLDPETETGIMKQLKRLTSQDGKTVVCITHTLQNIALFDKIIFLAPDGRLCFFGTRGEALEFFDVDDIVNAYEVVRKHTDECVSAFERGRAK